MKFYILSFIFFLNLSQTAYSQSTFNLATGSEGSVYFSIGLGLKAAIEKGCPEITIALHPTAGSIENAWLLSNNEVQFALIQSDIAGKFRNGEQMFMFPSESMVAIATLFPEIIHLVARKGSGIKTLKDLKGKRVSVGNKNSGTRYNAEDILKYLGIKDNEIDKKYLSPLEVNEAFINNSIDAAFYTTGVPSQSISSIYDIVEVINFDSTSVSGLIKQFPYFGRYSIPANSYPGQLSAIHSVGMNLLFVTRRDIDRRTIGKITKAIFTYKAEIVKSHIVAKNINLENSYKVNSLELHSGASEYYKDSERIERAFTDYLLDGITYFLLLSILIFSVYNHKKFRYNYSRNQYFQIAVVLTVLFTIGTLGTYWFEKSVNKNFDNIIETFWTTIIYLLSGFEGNNPITVGGKISSIFILVGSVALLGSVIGHFTSLFIMESKKKMPVDLNKHIAICYWNSRGDTIIKELRNSEMAANKEIIVLHDNDVNEKELRDKNNYYKNVFFIEGDPTKSKTLSDARVDYAESVIILAGKNDSSADPMTILTCLAIEKLCSNDDEEKKKKEEKAKKDKKKKEENAEKDEKKSKKNKKDEKQKPRIIAELMDRNNREIALNAGADEIVSAGFYRTGIMLQSALFPNLSDIFHELLSYGSDKTSVYILDGERYPKDWEGKTFKQIVTIINDNRDEENPVILLGIRREGKVMLNPQMDLPEGSKKLFDKLVKGDALAVIAQKHPDLTKIIK